ncbi:MAG: hypothetical protein KDC71_22330 [Acidobacteria bacterium]|nr:hypothetical protein [Acidobacteriota bacterium]
MLGLLNVRVGTLTLGWLACSLAWANVKHIPTITDIDYRGSFEQAGSITFCVDGNDFFLPTPGSPVYIRVSLDLGVVLSETLVGPTPTLALHRPYYLGAFVVGPPGITINMPPDAISIARWKAGESAFWLRVTTPSDEWINDGGVLKAPKPDMQVFFRIGISGNQSSAEMAALYLAGKANRPFNSDFYGEPADTLLNVDASASILGFYPGPNGELYFSPMPMDGQTIGVQSAQHSSQIVPGSDSGVNLTGKTVIAHAYALGRSVPALGFLGRSVLVVSLLAFSVIQIKRAREKTNL